MQKSGVRLFLDVIGESLSGVRTEVPPQVSGEGQPGALRVPCWI